MYKNIKKVQNILHIGFMHKLLKYYCCFPYCTIFNATITCCCL